MDAPAWFTDAKNKITTGVTYAFYYGYIPALVIVGTC
jgi:hypothetical protein